MREPTSIPGLLGGREAEGEAVCVWGGVFVRARCDQKNRHIESNKVALSPHLAPRVARSALNSNRCSLL